MALGGLELGVLVAVMTFVFGAGVYVGRNDVSREVAIVEERLRSHEGILVHKGAVPRTQYEPEVSHIRDKMRDLEGRIHDLEQRHNHPTPTAAGRHNA